MVNALADMQDAVRGSVDAVEGQFEELQGWLIGLALLGGNDIVEIDFESRTRGGEKVVVDIGENGEAEARFKLEERGHSIGPRLPGRKRLGERAGFFGRGSESETGAEATDDRLEDFAVRMEFSLFGELLEVAVEFEQGRIVHDFVVCRKNAMERGENAGFPIDERTVAVEGEDFEAGEIKHESGVPFKD